MLAQVSLLARDLAQRVIRLLGHLGHGLLVPVAAAPLAVESLVEVLWRILGRPVVLEVVVTASTTLCGAEDLVGSAQGGSLALAAAGIGRGLALLHVVDAAVGNALLFSELLGAGAEGSGAALVVKALKRLFSEAIAGCLLLPLRADDVVHGVAGKAHLAARVNAQLADVEVEADVLLAGNDYLDNLVLEELEENLDEFGAAVTDLGDGLEAHGDESVVKHLVTQPINCNRY